MYSFPWCSLWPFAFEYPSLDRFCASSHWRSKALYVPISLLLLTGALYPIHLAWWTSLLHSSPMAEKADTPPKGMGNLGVCSLIPRYRVVVAVAVVGYLGFFHVVAGFLSCLGISCIE